MAPLYILMALAGFGLLAFAPGARLTAPTFGFLSLAAGLLFSGLAELAAGGSPRVRAAFRLIGFVLGVLGLLILVLPAAASTG